MRTYDLAAVVALACALSVTVSCVPSPVDIPETVLTGSYDPAYSGPEER